MAKADFKDGPGKTRILPLGQILRPGADGIRDVTSTYWFSALQPVKTMGPSNYQPRQWAFTPGANLIWQPKGDNPITFAALRGLADGWDLLRLMIEQRKDELCALPWEIRAKQKPGETNKDSKERNLKDPNVQKLNEFFQKPDGFHPFVQWMRLWLEDMIVIDAVALWHARDKGGKVATIHPIAGDTINRMLTDQGLTPPPDSIAYQQVVYGTPVYDFTTDDMLYYMSNERTDKRYGYSKVEQLLVTINIGIRRQLFQLNYYTDGNMPEAMVFLPSDLPIDRVKEVQSWFDLSLAGDLAARRRITFLPGYGSGDQSKPNVVFPKEVLLKDAMDEWLVQIAAFCIGVSAQPFLKMVNRASAEEANDAAQQGGLEPDKIRVLTVLNACLDMMGMSDDYEWTAQQARENDVYKQAQADALLVGKVETVNEIREMRGLDPRSEPEADQLGEFTQQGFVPLGSTTQQPGDDAGGAGGGNESEDEQGAGGSGNGGAKTPKGKQTQSKLAKSGKKTKVVLDASRNTRTAEIARRGLKKAISKQLGRAKAQLIKQVKSSYPKQFTKLRKDKFDLDSAIVIEWGLLPDDVREHLMDVAMEGATFGLGQLSIDEPGMISKANKTAASWADDRAAEMIGKRWKDGELVDNPDAHWAISDSTRDAIKSMIGKAFEDETSLSDLIEQIDGAGIFDPIRADTIARTEVSMAQNQGNLLGWKQSGLVSKVSWVLSSDHDSNSDCDCAENADEGPYDIDEVPDFPAHPNCMCNLQTAVILGAE